MLSSRRYGLTKAPSMFTATHYSPVATGYALTNRSECGLLNQSSQRIQIDRLGEVLVEPGFERTLLVFFLSPARECDQYHLVASLTTTQLSGSLVTVHAGHSNVQQHDIRLEGFGNFKRLGTIEADRNFAAHHF